jgi:polysaccharide biosynthesis protein PslH
MKRHCIVIAQGYPRNENGFGLAMISSLKEYERSFDRVTYVSITHEVPDEQCARLFANVRFVHVPIVLQNPKRRFAASVLGTLPASVMQMNSPAVWTRLEEIVTRESEDADRIWCIVENFSPSIFISRLKLRYPKATVVYRAHDVPSLAFAPFTKHGLPWSRLAWKWEVARIRKLEEQSIAAANRVWAITSDDATAIESLYKRKCDGVLGVRLDLARYTVVQPGSYHRLLYVGSSDVRKAQGLLRFLAESWPQIKARVPEMELWIAGAGTERFAGCGAGVRALGAVPDEREFLGSGRIVINPQEAGTGIKLKSLVALASGKLLVSTWNGVMGIEGGESGKHYLANGGGAEMARDVAMLSANRDLAESIAAAGRCLMEDTYDLCRHPARDNLLFLE